MSCLDTAWRGLLAAEREEGNEAAGGTNLRIAVALLSLWLGREPLLDLLHVAAREGHPMPHPYNLVRTSSSAWSCLVRSARTSSPQGGCNHIPGSTTHLSFNAHPSPTSLAVRREQAVVLRAAVALQVGALPTLQQHSVQLVFPQVLQTRGFRTAWRVVQHASRGPHGIGCFARLVPEMK